MFCCSALSGGINVFRTASRLLRFLLVRSFIYFSPVWNQMCSCCITMFLEMFLFLVSWGPNCWVCELNVGAELFNRNLIKNLWLVTSCFVHFSWTSPDSVMFRFCVSRARPGQRSLTKLVRRRVQCYSGEQGAHASSGALLARPHETKFGAAKCAIVIGSCIYTGAMISKSGAAFLEENEIFVPEDDD